jgi:hypothetical protein
MLFQLNETQSTERDAKIITNIEKAKDLEGVVRDLPVPGVTIRAFV